MERYKTILKIDTIKKKLEEGKCQEALALAEEIEIRKIKNLSDLGIIAECYFQNGIYAHAKEIFLKIYEQNPSRRIIAQMVHLSIKLNDVTEAEYYLEQFIKRAPDDFYRYIFRYSIDKQKKEPLSTLIEDLIQLKKTEYIESWAYELAKLYHKAGKKDECIKECESIILWFGNGEYVDRARALKSYYLGELDTELLQGDQTEPVDEKESQEEQDQDLQTDSEVSTSQEEVTHDFISKQELEEQSMIDTLTEAQTEVPVEASVEVPEEELMIEQQVTKEQAKQAIEKVTYPVAANDEIVSSEEYEELLACVLKKNVSLGMMLGNYVRMPQVKEQIIRSFDQAMTRSSEHVMLVITGDTEFERTGLAKRLSKVCAYLGISDSRRLALVHGEKINHIDLLDKLTQLRQCAIVIEHASQMTKTAVDMLKELNEMIDTRIIIVIQDTRRNMDQFLSTNPSLTSIFINRIHLPELIEESVMGYLYDYITERDYEIESTAFEEMRKKVQIALCDQKESIFDHLMPKVNQIMDNTKARSTRQLMEMSQSGKYVAGEFMMIKKEDLID